MARRGNTISGAATTTEGGFAKPKPAHGSRLLGMDGVRGVAAICIVAWHTYIFAAPGGVPDYGVVTTHVLPQLQLSLWTFFCLSAFLLYRPFAASILRGRDRPSVRAYLANRALRIVPAYWVILTLITFVFGVAVIRIPESGTGVHLPTFLADMFFVQSYFPKGVLTGISPSWSLSVEVIFYLALPLLAGLAASAAVRTASRRGRVLACLLPAAVMLVIGLVSKQAGYWYGYGPDDVFGYGQTWFAVWERSFFSQADLLAFGMVLAVLKVEIEDDRLHLPKRWQWGFFAGAAAISIPAIVLNRRGALPYHHFNSLMAVVNGLLVGMVALVRRDAAANNRLVRPLEWKPILYTGMISYSIFLWHYPVVFWVREHGLTIDGRAAYLLNLVVVIAITWVLAAITYRFVEAPFIGRKVRQRVGPKREQAGPTPAPQVQAAP